jgi:hypothetical protein
MPKFVEKKLKEEYGENSKTPYKVMNAIGAMRGNQETEKGREMEAKHKQDTEMKKYSGSASSYKHSRPVRKIVKRSFHA